VTRFYKRFTTWIQARLRGRLWSRIGNRSGNWIRRPFAVNEPVPADFESQFRAAIGRSQALRPVPLSQELWSVGVSDAPTSH